MKFSGMFRPRVEMEKPVIGPDKIIVPLENSVLAGLQEDMDSRYRKRLLGMEETARKASGAALQEAMENYLFDLYKFQIRLALLRSGSVDRELLAQNLRVNHPTDMAAFNVDLFDEAFMKIGIDMGRRLGPHAE